MPVCSGDCSSLRSLQSSTSSLRNVPRGIPRAHIAAPLLLVFLAAAVGLGCHGSDPSGADRHTISECIGDPACEALLVCAHRGVAFFLPENTLIAFEHAIRHGADVIEIDVRQSADGEFVVMHDATVERTTTGLGLVVDMTLDEIKALRIKTDELVLTAISGLDVGYEPALVLPADMTVPTFVETVERIDGRAIVYVDFKAGDRAALARLIRDLGRQDQVYIAARNLDQARELAAVSGTVLMGNPDGIAEIDAYADLGAVLMEIGIDEVTPRVLERIDARGAKLFVNTLTVPDLPVRALVMADLDRVDLAAWAGLIAAKLFSEGVIPIQPGFLEPISRDEHKAVWDLVEGAYGRFVSAGADVIQTDFLDLLVPYIERVNGF